MKLLFDQNLSHRLPFRLADLYPESKHVRALRLDQASDDEIWTFARESGYTIVTQDADFAERSRVFGAPPKVIWLRCGNSTPGEIEALLRRSTVVISELLQVPALDYAELF